MPLPLELTRDQRYMAKRAAAAGLSDRTISTILRIPSTTWQRFLKRNQDFDKELKHLKAMQQLIIVERQMSSLDPTTLNKLASHYVEEQKNIAVEESKGIVGPITFVIRSGEAEYPSYKEVYGEEETKEGITHSKLNGREEGIKED